MKLVIAILLVIIAVSLTGLVWLWWLLVLPIVIFLALVIGTSFLCIFMEIYDYIETKIEIFKQKYGTN